MRFVEDARRAALVAMVLLLWLATSASATNRAQFDRHAFQVQYREVLTEWSTGRGGVDALVELEARVLDSSGRGAVDNMWRAEFKVLRDLFGGDRPGVLATAALLHEQSYLAHLRTSPHVLAVHARTITVKLLFFYAKQVASAPERALAADILASLAGHLLEMAMAQTSEELYLQALKINPENAAALLGHATLLERVGNYDEAISVLKTLIGLEPEIREGRLRLAVNLSRVGRVGESAGVLQQLLTVGGHDWIVALAYQELARILSENGEVSAALGLLAAAVEQFPDESTLWIQLDRLQDRFHLDPDIELLPSLERASRGAQQDSSRSVYLGVCNETLIELREDLLLRNRLLLTDLIDSLALRGSNEVGN